MKSLSKYVCCLLALAAAVASADPKFYQPVQHNRVDAAVSELLETGWIVRDHDPLALNPPIDWAAEGEPDSNWVAQLNSMYILAPVFLKLAEDYRPELHDLAREIFSDWIDFNIERDIDHRFRWHDMSTGSRAAYLAQLIHYERLVGESSALARLEAAALAHLSILANPEKLADSNHGIMQLVGIAALCEVLEADLCVEPMAYANEAHQMLFSRQFSTEGIHLEHSPGYHLYAIVAYRRIEASGLLALSPENAEILAAAERNLQYMIHPDGGFAEIGDTSANSRRAGRYHPQALWLTSGGVSGDKPADGIRHFPESGLVSVRDLATESFLYVTTAHHSRAHKHLDTGSFEWSDRGERVLIDSGKWGYDRGVERNYFLSPQAHNVVVSEGTNLSPGDVPEVPPQVEVAQHGRVVVVQITLTGRRKLLDAMHLRSIVLNPGEWLLVADRVVEWLPTGQTQWFQVSPATELTETEEGFELTMESGRRLSASALAFSQARVSARGQRESMLGWYSGEYRELVPSWQFGFRTVGREATLVTLFRWLSPDSEENSLTPALAHEADQWSLCWQKGARIDGAVLSKRGGRLAISSCGDAQ